MTGETPVGNRVLSSHLGGCLLCMDFVAAFGAASRASGQLHLLSFPVDLRIVFLEPGKPKDHILPAESGDRKEDPLCVTTIPED